MDFSGERFFNQIQNPDNNVLLKVDGDNILLNTTFLENG